MDNNSNSNSNNNFFSGFLLGLLVGAAVVFFLATKKGKRLLKVISEEGINNISNILEEADKSVGLDEVVREEEVPLRKEISFKEKSTEKPKVRRFFRGISRHVN